jgi:hypothetical protein
MDQFGSDEPEEETFPTFEGDQDREEYRKLWLEEQEKDHTYFCDHNKQTCEVPESIEAGGLVMFWEVNEANEKINMNWFFWTRLNLEVPEELGGGEDRFLSFHAPPQQDTSFNAIADGGLIGREVLNPGMNSEEFDQWKKETYGATFVKGNSWFGLK